MDMKLLTSAKFFYILGKSNAADGTLSMTARTSFLIP